MKKRILYIVWLVLYLLCAGLGHIHNPDPTQQMGMTALAVLFFIPGFSLLTDSWKQKDKKTCAILFYISLGSLVLTVLMLLVNLLSVTGSQALGDVVYVMLNWLSVPMLCSGYWIISLFLWSVLLFSTITCKKKM